MRLKSSLLAVGFAALALLGVRAQPTSVEIPFRGNTYVTQCTGASFSDAASGIIDTYKGTILRWDDPETVLSLYFKVGAPGELELSAECYSPRDKGATLFFEALGRRHKVRVDGNRPRTYRVGKFLVDRPGYVKVDIRGLKKGKDSFADIFCFRISGPAAAGENHFVPFDRRDDCYWFRRGPSVHLGYRLPEEDVEWFYNEAIVPEGNDVDGTYFMLTGFREGYMGIQSTTKSDGSPQRNVLFSVWSPYTTDDPRSIPEEDRVRTLRRGDNVRVKDFGGEGSGGQSHMLYPWETGKVYKTLVQVKPDGRGNTVYTGYFCNEKGEWMLLASFLRPKTDTFYKGAHSFLECFRPESSITTRRVIFLNQWVRTRSGRWEEITEATFTCDGTGLSGVRTDLAGGVEEGHFFLRNCGFFNDATPYRSKFVRPAAGRQPDIDFEALEKM